LGKRKNTIIVQRFILFFFFPLLISFSDITAQDIPPPFLSSQDTVFLGTNARGQKIYKYALKKGQTLYSLSKFYGLPLSKLYAYNPGTKDKVISIGQEIALPIPNRAIMRTLKPGQKAKDFVPVYYLARKGDTMFGIAVRKFRMSVDTLKARNQLESHDLKVGQPIWVGWMSKEGIDPEWQYPQGNPGDVMAENDRNRADFLSRSRWVKTRTHQGKAQWQNDNQVGAPSGLFCLHKSAPKNSIIRIENPLTNNVVYAKVVGRVPMNYEKWVVMVLSKDAARALRAPDKRFFVRAEYFIK
jgi:LysM repeat protein